MKGNIIGLNWALSLMGLSIDTEYSAFGAVMLMFCWFVASSLLLIYASRRGWTGKVIKTR